MWARTQCQKTKTIDDSYHHSSKIVFSSVFSHQMYTDKQSIANSAFTFSHCEICQGCVKTWSSTKKHTHTPKIVPPRAKCPTDGSVYFTRLELIPAPPYDFSN